MMRINEVLTELTFSGSQCTKDCSGHSAGYAWAKQHNGQAACNSSSPSFNRGCEIAADQIKQGKPNRPKIRNQQGKFAPKPIMPQPKKQQQPVQTNPTTPTKPIAPR